MKNVLLCFGAWLLILALSACEKDCIESSGLHGEWEWIKSTGGFAGVTITPETIMAKRSVKIDELYFREYQNDSLIFEAQYDFYVGQDTVFGTNKYIVFGSGDTQAVILENSHLQIIELCFDCFEHHYERK